MRKKEFVYVLNYLKSFKAVRKNNPRTHSLQQNKKAVLMAAAYFKVSIPVTGAGPEISKRGALYVSHHGWPANKILGFR